MAQVDAKEMFREALVYYKEFRSQIVSDMEGYSSGRWFTGEIKNGQRIDTTAQTIAELNRRLAYVDKLIAAYQTKLDT